MASIICGNCSQRHTSVQGVKDCHAGYSAEVVFARSAGLDPTQKQLDFAHGLLRSKDLPADSPLRDLPDQEAHELINGMSKGDISEFITTMKGQPYRSKKEARTEPISVDEGMYMYSGKIYRVQRAVHGSGHLYAKIYNRDTGKFSHETGILSKLAPKHKMSLEDAKKYGALYGVCMICGRTLTDEDSIAAGIGPVCAGKQNMFS